MVNLLKIVWVSCFERKSGIKQNLLVGIYTSVMVIVFYVVGFVRDSFYLSKGIYDYIDVKLIWGQFGE